MSPTKCRSYRVDTCKVSSITVAVRIIPELEAATEPALAHDSSTNALIRRYRAQRGA